MGFDVSREFVGYPVLFGGEHTLAAASIRLPLVDSTPRDSRGQSVTDMCVVFWLTVVSLRRDIRTSTSELWNSLVIVGGTLHGLGW